MLSDNASRYIAWATGSKRTTVRGRVAQHEAPANGNCPDSRSTSQTSPQVPRVLQLHRLGACRFGRVARAGGLITTSTPPSSREAARGGVRELVEKHGSGRRTHHRHPKFPLAMALPSILRGVVHLFGAASSSSLEPLSLGFHGGQSSIECSHPCGDGRILSYSL